MDSLKEAFGVLLHPGQVTKTQRSIGDMLKFYYKVMIIPMILGIILSIAMGLSSPISLGASLGAVVVYYIVLFPLGILFDAGIYHVIIGKLFRIYSGSYTRVVNAFAFAIVPVIFIYWISIPLMGGVGIGAGASLTSGFTGIIGMVLLAIFGIWSFIVMLFALSSQLNMSKAKAFGTLILEAVIVFIIVAVIEIAVLGSVANLLGHIL